MSDSTAAERLIDALTAHGRAVRHGGAGIMAQCPAHDDGNPSLSIRAVEGQVLVYCFAGCQTRDVLASLGMTEADLYDERSAIYKYDDGRTVHRRYDKTGKKRFAQKGHRPGSVQLYRLSKVTAAVEAGQTVHLVEGEKDVHAIESLGGVATTAPMGAANFNKVDISPLHAVVIVAVVDRDAAGARWATAVHDRLDGFAASLTFVESAAGKDAADHVAAGYGLDEFAPYTAPGRREHPPATTVESLWLPTEFDADGNYVAEVPDGWEEAPDWADDRSAGRQLVEAVQAAEAQAVEQGETPGEGRRIVFRSAADMRMTRVRWLQGHEQGGHIPLGAITLLAGREGIGKSTITYDVIAKVTTGTLRGEFYGTPKGVVIYATEDDWEPVILPRLIAAGANLPYVHRADAYEDMEKDWISFPRDLVRLGEQCRKHDVGLVVIDPIMSIIDGKLDTHKDREVRQVLDPLARFAAAIGAAVVGLIHVNKSGGTDPLNSVMGSRAFSAVARSVLYCIRVPKPDGDTSPDEYLFSQEKCNLGPPQGSQKYGLSTVRLDGVDEHGQPFPIYTSKVVWGSTDDRRAGDVMEEATKLGRPKGRLREEILAFLRTQVGGVSTGEIVAALPNHSEGSVKVTLGRMFKDGELVKPVLGLYRLPGEG